MNKPMHVLNVPNLNRSRRADAGVDWALLVTGYSQDALAQFLQADLGSAERERKGAAGVLATMSRTDCALAERALGA